MDYLGVTLDEQASARGVEACEIATALRKKYRLGRPELVYDYQSRLQTVLKASKQEREEREASQAAFLQELSSMKSEFPD